MSSIVATAKKWTIPTIPESVYAAMSPWDTLKYAPEYSDFLRAGTHKAHAACSAMWLAGATTCPTCRFALPSHLPTSRTLGSLLEPAICEAARILEGGPPPCLPIDEEAPELADLSLLFRSGRPSARR